MTITTPYGMELTEYQYAELKRKYPQTSSKQVKSSMKVAYECRNGTIYKISMSDDEFNAYMNAR